MDPRIAWYPDEFMGNAYTTWANIWMNAQLSLALESGQSPRPHNKASTFGLNFPIYQHILDDPMSTPWFCLPASSSTASTTATTPQSPSHLSIQPPQSSSTTASSSSSVSSSSSLAVSPVSSLSFASPVDYSSSATTPSPTPSATAPQAAVFTSTTSQTADPSPGTASSSSSSSSSAATTSSSSSSSSSYDEVDECSESLKLLHKEITLFADYIAPTFEELYMRNEIIWRITKVIKDEFPFAEVDVFGSYKTGLFLPTSDIDMVVFGEWPSTSLPLNYLKDALIRERISDHENIKVLDKASVPIIKILETRTELKIDISFNTVNGVKSAALIKQFLAEFPCLRPLVMVLKQFLLQRDYNEVWTGGIGSYSLILMTVSFLQLHPRINCRSEQVNLGLLLIEFFEFYGRIFNYMKSAIRIRDGGCYVPKDELIKQFMANGYRSSILCIEDPLNDQNDIGKGSYGALKVKQAFEYAYFTLSNAVLPQNEFLFMRPSDSSSSSSSLSSQVNPPSRPTSILGRIIRITKEVTDYRNWIKQTYQEKIQVVLNLTKYIIVFQQQQQQQQHQQHQQQHHHEQRQPFIHPIHSAPLLSMAHGQASPSNTTSSSLSLLTSSSSSSQAVNPRINRFTSNCKKA